MPHHTDTEARCCGGTLQRILLELQQLTVRGTACIRGGLAEDQTRVQTCMVKALLFLCNDIFVYELTIQWKTSV